MVNELTVLEKINTKLKTNDNGRNIFPIGANHRKELRQLRDDKIGNINIRLKTIRKLKEAEYFDKNKDKIEKSLKKRQKECNELNNNWENFLFKINQLLEERKEFEKNFDTSIFTCQKDYSNIGSLQTIDTKRFYSINFNDVIKNICQREFKEKYGKSFDIVSEKINDLTTKYEEAINFGDLITVKELYYIMKDSEEFFTKISNLVI